MTNSIKWRLTTKQFIYLFDGKMKTICNQRMLFKHPGNYVHIGSNLIKRIVRNVGQIDRQLEIT